MNLQPLQIVGLFELNKTSREEFVSLLIDSIDSGNADALKMQCFIKNMEAIAKGLNENTIYKKSLIDSASQRGKSFEYFNAKFEVKEVGVKYDYSQCNDIVYKEMIEELEAITTKVKEREKFLKTIPSGGLLITDPVSGETFTAYPPSKSSTTSVAVTLK